MSNWSDNPELPQVNKNIPGARPISCLFLHNLLRLKDDQEPVPLHIMKPIKPFPLPADVIDFSQDINWLVLIPRWDFRFLFTIVVVISYGFTVLIWFLPTLRPGNINFVACYIFGAIFTGVSLLFTAMRVNIARNQSLRATICRAMAKADEARRIYESGVVPAYLVKETYIELKAFLGPSFNVFRDGTVEDNRSEFMTEQQHEMQGKIGNRTQAMPQGAQEN